jgi:PBP1b-binding outer membrane lipoprotein LpoB
MKKVLSVVFLSILIFSCSQNFEKKKEPPKAPQNYKEAKPVEKNEK